MTDVPHFAYPLRFDESYGFTGFAEVEQDSGPDVLMATEITLRWPLGFTDEQPDYGLPDLAFVSGGVDFGIIKAEVDQWEPRAHVTLSDGEYEELVDEILVGVAYG